jgi:ketosteroid isomerase-like protein
MPQPALVTARAFVDAINRHDLEALCGLMSEEHRFVDSLGAVFQGRDSLRAGWESYLRMVPDYALDVRETFCEGMVVVMLGIARGTYVKDRALLPENRWQTPAAFRAEIGDGRVIEWRVYADNEPFRQRIAANK